jgi:hypothetical protein
MATILPPLTHLAAAVASIGNIEFSHVGASHWGKTVSFSQNIFPGKPERGNKTFGKQYAVIDPKTVELQFASPLLFADTSGGEKGFSCPEGTIVKVNYFIGMI